MPRPGSRLFTHHLGRPFHAFAVLVADNSEKLAEAAARGGQAALHKAGADLMREAGVPKDAIPTNLSSMRRIIGNTDPDLDDTLTKVLGARRGGHGAAQRALAVLNGSPPDAPDKPQAPPSLEAYVESIAADVAELKDLLRKRR